MKDNESFIVISSRNIIKRKALTKISSNIRKVRRPKLFADSVFSNQSIIQISSNQSTEFIQKVSTQIIQSSESIAMKVNENIIFILNK